MSENIVAAAYGENGTKATEVQRILRRHDVMKGERSTWDPTYRDISDFIAPRRGRFFTDDKNKGDRKDRRIINNKATRAARAMSAGIMSGCTNPLRPWLRYTTVDPELNESDAVKTWLATLVERTLWVFQRSNIYMSLHGVYADLAFGTAAVHIEEDPERVIRAYLYPVGSYCLANSSRYRVDTVYREFQMSAAQLVERFGMERVSQRVKDAHSQGRRDDWFNVLHVLEPNVDLKTGKLGPEGMKTRSRWMERGPEEGKQFLSEGGYDEMPAMCPRWSTNGEDIYGTGPGHEAIGDARALQTLEKRAAQMVDKLASPAMQIPSAQRMEPVSMNPNSHNFVDSVGPAQMIRPVYEVNPAGLQAVEAKIREHERRIEEAFFADLWLMLSNTADTQRTAYEVARLQEEKMLLLGPVLQRLDEELLDPLVERTFRIMLRRGLVPPPPQELQGQDLKVEYISILAQAQKLIGIQSVRELTMQVGALAQMQLAAQQPVTALDKLDVDQVVDEYADMLGAPPGIVRSDEQVAALRGQRAQAQQAQQQMAAAQQMAETAKTASQAQLGDGGGDNVLARMLPAITGQPPSA